MKDSTLQRAMESSEITIDGIKTLHVGHRPIISVLEAEAGWSLIKAGLGFTLRSCLRKQDSDEERTQR